MNHDFESKWITNQACSSPDEEWFSEIKAAVVSKVAELIEQNENGEKDLEKFLEEDLDALRVAAVAQMLALDEESLKKSDIFLELLNKLIKFYIIFFI